MRDSNTSIILTLEPSDHDQIMTSLQNHPIELKLGTQGFLGCRDREVSERLFLRTKSRAGVGFVYGLLRDENRGNNNTYRSNKTRKSVLKTQPHPKIFIANLLVIVRPRYNGPRYNGTLDIVARRAGTKIFTCCRLRYNGIL